MADLPLSNEVKAAAIQALDKHIADMTADVNRVKAAIVADLPGVTTAGVSIESIIKAEVAKIRADIKPIWKNWMTYAALGVASVVGGAGVWLLH